MNFKPGDFFFGIVDFLSFLVPGFILLMVFPELMPDYIKVNELLEDTKSDTVIWIVIALEAYVFGHFVHHLSALLLDPICNCYYKLKGKLADYITKNNWSYFNHLKKHTGYVAFFKKTDVVISGIIKDHPKSDRVANAYVRYYKPSLVPEIEKHQANAKLFRSLCVLCVLLCFHKGLSPLYRSGLVFCTLLSFSRFANQKLRQKMLTYEFFTLMNADDDLKKDRDKK